MNDWRSGCIRLAAALVMLVGLAACRSEDNAAAEQSLADGQPPSTASETAVVEGSVAYRQQITLPKDATVVVRLIDMSKGGAAGTVAEHSFAANSQVPIRFSLPYDPGRVSSGRTYGIEARILVDGALWFISEQPVAVLTRGAPDTVQVMLRVAPQPG